SVGRSAQVASGLLSTPSPPIEVGRAVGDVQPGRCSDQALEVPGEVRLVVKAGADSDVGRRPPVEELQPGDLYAPTDSVGMGSKAERPREAANQGSRARSKLAAGRSERQRLNEVCIQQGSKFLGQRAAPTPLVVVDSISEVAAKPLDDEREATLCLQGVVGAIEQFVDGGETATKCT